jgi:hypothetical protein
MLIRETSICFLLLASFAAAQSSTQAPVESTEPQSDSPRRAPISLAHSNSTIVIPAGSRVPLSLKQAISTKTARSGDPVYAVTTFPFVINDRIVIRRELMFRERLSVRSAAATSKGAPNSWSTSRR